MENPDPQYILYGSKSDVIELHCLADIHYGNRAAHIKQCKKDIAEIAADPHSFAIGGGDYAEFIAPGDPRWDAKCLDRNMKIEVLEDLGWHLSTKVKELFEPIAPKCVGLLEGNHEYNFFNHRQQGAMHTWLADQLHVPYLGYCAMFDLVFIHYPGVDTPVLLREPPKRKDTRGSTFRVRIFAHHGAGSARTAGGKIKKIHDCLCSFDCDVAFLAHLHDRKADRRSVMVLGRGGKHIKERTQVGVITGSYLRTYCEGVTTYGERRLYAPVTFGPASVRIYPQKRVVKAEV